MKPLSEMTVGEAAAHSRAAAALFESHGIAFCCEGQISITEACLARELDPGAVLRELEQVAQRAEAGIEEWENAAADELIDHIVERHHAYLRRQLPRIQKLFEAVMSHELGGVPHTLFVCFRGMREALEARLMQQETVLFPALRDQERRPPIGHWNRGAEHDPVHLMMEGHDATAKALSEIRRITANYKPPMDAGPGYHELYRALRELEGDLHRHFHLENNILFRRIDAAARFGGAGAACGKMGKRKCLS